MATIIGHSFIVIKGLVLSGFRVQSFLQQTGKIIEGRGLPPRAETKVKNISYFTIGEPEGYTVWRPGRGYIVKEKFSYTLLKGRVLEVVFLETGDSQRIQLEDGYYVVDIQTGKIHGPHKATLLIDVT